MDSLELILKDRPIAYHPILAHKCGGVTAGVFLSQILYWTGISEDGWVYRTAEQLQEETGLSRREMGTARTDLGKIGVLTEKKKGHSPPVLHYKVDFVKLDAILRTEQINLHKTSKSNFGKRTNHSAQNEQIVNKNKEITNETKDENINIHTPRLIEIEIPEIWKETIETLRGIPKWDKSNNIPLVEWLTTKYAIPRAALDTAYSLASKWEQYKKQDPYLTFKKWMSKYEKNFSTSGPQYGSEWDNYVNKTQHQAEVG